MPRTSNWLRFDSKQKRCAAIRKVMARLRRDKVPVTSTQIARRFRNITRMGIVTHCWRNGPKLPNARRLRRLRR